MKALNKRAVIKKIGVGTMTESGLYTPDMGTSKDDITMGVVEVIDDDEDVKVNDEVIFCKTRTEELTLNIKNKFGLSGDYYVIYISDILIVK